MVIDHQNLRVSLLSYHCFYCQYHIDANEINLGPDIPPNVVENDLLISPMFRTNT